MENFNKIDIEALPMKIEYVTKTERNSMGEKPWQCFEWRVTFDTKDGHWSLPYYCGLAHVTYPKGMKNPYPSNVIGWELWENQWAKPKKPSNADILHSLLLDASAADENFKDWCANYGYSDDSISALNTYRECLEISTNLRKHLGADTVRALAVQLQDH